MTRRSDRSRELWRLLEPIHAVTYFSPEPLAALKAAGFRGYWMGYFAGRAAPLGAAGPELVHAIFYNFGVDRVRAALPDAWDHGSPAAALAAREQGSSAALLRLTAQVPEVGRADLARAADLALDAALSAPIPGRALFAANLALSIPSDPAARLWHAATLLREHRGDGHIASLLAAGIGGREAHVLISAAGRTPRDVFRVARDFEDGEWAACRASLAACGLLDDTGLTEPGRQVTSGIEAVTDELAATAYDALGDDGSDELARVLEPITRAVVAGGEIPLESPMGLDLRPC